MLLKVNKNNLILKKNLKNQNFTRVILKKI